MEASIDPGKDFWELDFDLDAETEIDVFIGVGPALDQGAHLGFAAQSASAQLDCAGR